MIILNVQQQPEPAQSPVPVDAVKAIAEILKLASRPQGGAGFSSEWLHSMSEVIGSVAWPCVIVVVVFIFRQEIKNLINRLRKLGMAGASIEAEEQILNKISSSAAEALALPENRPVSPVTIKDFERSVEVANLSQNKPAGAIQAQIEQISAEYDALRANMPSGPARTRQMSAVMAKMRALGRTVYPYRQELINNPSPGQRLFAIAALQMLPDYNLLDWLASTTRTEAPYIQFQALNALLIAVRNAGPQMRQPLSDAAEKAISGLSPNDPDVSRWNLAHQIEAEVEIFRDK